MVRELQTPAGGGADSPADIFVGNSKLRILAAIAQPLDMPPLDLPNELLRIKAVLGGQADIDPLQEVTLDALHDKLRRGRPQFAPDYQLESRPGCVDGTYFDVDEAHWKRKLTNRVLM